MNTAITHDMIRLTGLSARGYHGVLPGEREDGQLFVIDVVMYLGCSGTAEAAASDDLDKTVDYAAVAAAIVEVIEGPSVNLIETLAERIAQVTLTFTVVHRVEVTVHKPQAPLEVAFDDVAVTICRGCDDVAEGEPSRVSAGALAGLASAGVVAAGVEAADMLPSAPAVAVGADEMALDLPYDSASVDASESNSEAAAEGEPAEAEDALVSAALADEDVVSGTVAPRDVLSEQPEQPTAAVIALGGNVGGVVASLRQAIRTLRTMDGVIVTDVAPLARTAAVVSDGAADQPDYLNTVVLVTTTLSPRDLLDVCHQLESDAGRVRTQPQGPRTLDADIITYEGVTSQDPDLTLPHPRAAERAFVLVPWAQVDPFAEIGDLAVATIAEEAPDRDGVRWLALDWLDSDHLPALPTGQYIVPPPAPEPEVGESSAAASEVDADVAEPVEAVAPAGVIDAGVDGVPSDAEESTECAVEEERNAESATAADNYADPDASDAETLPPVTGEDDANTAAGTDGDDAAAGASVTSSGSDEVSEAGADQPAEAASVPLPATESARGYSASEAPAASTVDVPAAQDARRMSEAEAVAAVALAQPLTESNAAAATPFASVPPVPPVPSGTSAEDGTVPRDGSTSESPEDAAPHSPLNADREWSAPLDWAEVIGRQDGQD